MAEIIFEPTFGDYHEDNFGSYTENPKPEILRDLIFNLDKDEWSGGAGNSNLTYEDGSFEAEIVIHGSLSDSSFLLSYSSSEEPSEVTLTTGKHTGEIRKVGSGGDAHPVYSEYLISKEMAWKAIDYFLKTGKKFESFQWRIIESPEFTY